MYDKKYGSHSQSVEPLILGGVVHLTFGKYFPAGLNYPLPNMSVKSVYKVYVEYSAYCE